MPLSSESYACWDKKGSVCDNAESRTEQTHSQLHPQFEACMLEEAMEVFSLRSFHCLSTSIAFRTHDSRQQVLNLGISSRRFHESHVKSISRHRRISHPVLPSEKTFYQTRLMCSSCEPRGSRIRIPYPYGGCLFQNLVIQGCMQLVSHILGDCLLSAFPCSASLVETLTMRLLQMLYQLLQLLSNLICKLLFGLTQHAHHDTCKLRRESLHGRIPISV